jgi:ABC-type Na+ transport system ATPase subunit NatA
MDGLAGTRARTSALSVHGLSKRFGDRVAFEDLSFEIGHGEVFGFLGPNGAGKTTTVRTLGTLLAPTSGSAVVAGIPLTPDNGDAIRRRISIMPESPGLYLRLSVAENLACFADLHEVPDPATRIDRALRAVGLADRAHDLCGRLSKGLRQRVALARALLGDPQVLFLDEPTSGLDPVGARDVHELITDLRERGVTIFLMVLQAEAAREVIDHDAGRAAETLDVMGDTGRRAINDLRSMLGLLRPGDARDPRSLAELVEPIRSAGLEVEVIDSGTSIPDHLWPTVYRVVQEALTNVIKHARASRVVLTVDSRDGRLNVEVADDGAGVATNAVGSRMGLASMSERVAACGGALTTGRVEPRGFRVLAVLPLGMAA